MELEIERGVQAAPLALDAANGLTPLYQADPYTAYGEDLDFMWRWTIYRDNRLVQEGCSLTLDASRRAVAHVMAVFQSSWPAIG
ncbi:soluble methane monooxygenase-binding protein MmoD [Methylomonas rhizoryzae]|uniref:soluble methane monooxygenase-binding protein MmoD n=1 Tax=Methylomonas rhizoryzae TaxID=2608981 RepID=UPI001231874C|nr:soluble methane monooxygenase-binding protein MmoD [Methylomonas rhizoryzae]